MLQLFGSDAVKIVCLLLGLALMGVELLLPGFGIAGISSLVLLGLGTACMWVQHGITAGLATLTVALLLAVIEGYLAIRSVSKGSLDRSKLILNSQTSVEPEKAKVRPGESGRTLTELNPVGFAAMGTERTEVLSESGFISKDVQVVVTAVEGKTIKVKKI